MKKKIVSLLKYLFFFGLGIFLVWWSMHQIPDSEWGKFKLSLANAHYILFIPVFIIIGSSHLLRALRWKLLMKPMGYSPTTANTFFAVMVGYLANMAVPRLGEVLKCTLLARYEKVPVEKIVGTIVAERAFDVLCLGLVFLLALGLQFDVVMGGFEMVKSISGKNKSNSILQNPNLPIILVVLVLLGIALLYWMYKTKKLESIFGVVKKIVAGIWEGLITAFKLKEKSTFLLLSLGIWTCYLAATWIGLYATDGTGLNIKVALSCLAFASIGMIVTPGGIGAYALLMAKVLELNGVDYTLGVANGTLQWFSQCIIVLILGFISLGLLPWYNKSKQ